MNIMGYINQIPDPATKRAFMALFDQFVADANANRTVINAFTATAPARAKLFQGGTLAVKATADPDLKTTTNIYYTASDGRFYIKAAAATIDLSAIAGYTPTALPTGFQRYYLVHITDDGTATWGVTEGANHASAAVLPATPSGKIAIGWLKIVNASAGNYTAGTTNTDAAGITATCADLCFNPVDATPTVVNNIQKA